MNSYINYHKIKYPKMTTQDIVKLLYQNHFGPGHFIKDIEQVTKYYYNELENGKPNNDCCLYEHIGNNFVRVNIFNYSKQFDNNYLIESFFNSSKFDFNNSTLKESFKNCLFSIEDDGFLKNYDYTNVHHSLIYNQLYNPHYRVINSSYLTIPMKVNQIQKYIDSFNDFTIFCLEGKCASGKTTLSNLLKDVTVIDVDEFFLRKELKTKERLAEIGGNIDYDLYLECIKKIKPNSTITYTIFDCSTQSYTEKTINIKNKILLCGVYSYHPKVRQYIDKLLYLIVDEKTQYERLKQRSMFKKFIEEWVPLENKYFDSFDFISTADLLI